MKKSKVIFTLLLVLASAITIAQIPIKDVTEVESIYIDDEDMLIDRNVVITRHIYGKQHLADVTGSEIVYFSQDRVSSTRLVTTTSGVTDAEFTALPFGQELTEKEVRYSFATGHEFDGDLYYLGARYYDPNLGRFTSVDPIKENNPYAYVENNPTNSVDSQGRDAENINAGLDPSSEPIEIIWNADKDLGPVMASIGFKTHNNNFWKTVMEGGGQVTITGVTYTRLEGTGDDQRLLGGQGGKRGLYPRNLDHGIGDIQFITTQGNFNIIDITHKGDTITKTIYKSLPGKIITKYKHLLPDFSAFYGDPGMGAILSYESLKKTPFGAEIIVGPFRSESTSYDEDYQAGTFPTGDPIWKIRTIKDVSTKNYGGVGVNYVKELKHGKIAVGSGYYGGGMYGRSSYSYGKGTLGGMVSSQGFKFTLGIDI